MWNRGLPWDPIEKQAHQATGVSVFGLLQQFEELRVQSPRGQLDFQQHVNSMSSSPFLFGHCKLIDAFTVVSVFYAFFSLRTRYWKKKQSYKIGFEEGPINPDWILVEHVTSCAKETTNIDFGPDWSNILVQIGHVNDQSLLLCIYRNRQTSGS